MDKSDWKPIETAPKDGTPILGLAKGDMTVVRWVTFDVWQCGGYWNLCECGSNADDGEWTPELWMPLPEPLGK